MGNPFTLRGSWPGWIACGAFAAAVLSGGRHGPGAVPAAADAATPPAFTEPLVFTNPYVPFVPGTVKVYAGREHGDAVVIVEHHRAETRTFEWNGGTVACRIVEEIAFERGAPQDRERTFLAQADDGSVWTFGEVEDDDPNDDEGEDADEKDGWIVGARAPDDPVDLFTDAAPAQYMPAAPQPGDVWAPEDHAPAFLKEARAQDVAERVRVAGGRFDACLRVRETDLVDGDVELRWFAPGRGLVRTRASGERLALHASTLHPRR